MIPVTHPTPPSVPSPEDESWNKHRQLLLQLPRSRVWRGCMGLALVISDTSSGVPKLGRFLVPDRDVRWISLLDVPPGHFRLRRPREVHLASVHRTQIRFGMPTIGSRPAAAVDFRFKPFGRVRLGVRVVEHWPDVLDPLEQLQLFRVLNALNWGMTSTAFGHRADWRARREHFFAAIGEEFNPETRILLFGEGRFDRVARPTAWMPRPFLAFKHVHRDRIFDWATRSGLADGLPHYSNSLKLRLCEDIGRLMPIQAPCSGRLVGAFRSVFHGLPALDLLFEDGRGERQVVKVTRNARILVLPSQVVQEGDLVASDGPEELPPGWNELGLYKRWRLLRRHLQPRNVRSWVRLWYERQFVTVEPNLVHVPSELAALAAQGHAVAQGLYWDLAPAMEYYNETADAFVFPTLKMKTWSQFSGVLPGDVAYDFAPSDPRFVPHSRHTRATPRRYRADRGNEEPAASPLIVSPTCGFSPRRCAALACT